MIVHEIQCDTCIHRAVCQHKISCESMRNEVNDSLKNYDANTFTVSIRCKYFKKSEPIFREGETLCMTR